MSSISIPEEQFQELVTSISEGRRSMADCKATYSGERDRLAVDNFLLAVNVFKKRENITDEQVLFAMPLLLKGDAAVWWTGFKSTIDTWDKFGSSLRFWFAPDKPAYILYQEIIGTKQQEDELTDKFIYKKRYLLSQLPEKHTESQELDMIYGSLNFNIRERVWRNNISTFDGLIDQAREVERILEEMKQLDGKEESEKEEEEEAEKEVLLSPVTPLPVTYQWKQ